MFWKQLFATKSLEILQAEVKGENRLRRVLGPISLTALGVGAIIGAGIFVMTGRVAAQDAGPAVVLSFVVAGFGCLFAALCYAEFASMAPVAGSAYTYAYATLGELFAWIIGWDLILEYAMACACVAASWSKYLNEFLHFFNWHVPAHLCSDPFSTAGAWFNLPALLITLLVTGILVIGIRESATTNAVLVAVKLGVVLFVIFAGISFVTARNWTDVPVTDRVLPEELLIDAQAKEVVVEAEQLQGEAAKQRMQANRRAGVGLLQGGPPQASGREVARTSTTPRPTRPRRSPSKRRRRLAPKLPKNDADKALVAKVLVAGQGESSGEGDREMGHSRPDGTEPEAGVDRRRGAFAVHALRSGRHRLRRLDRLFRLHRFRCHLDAGRGGEEAAARRAHRHPRLVGAVYAAVHRRGRRHHRHDPVSGDQIGGGGGGGVPSKGGRRRQRRLPALGRPAHLHRRPGRHDQRADDYLSQSGAHLPGHGARPSVAAGHLRRHPSTIPHAAPLDAC